MKEKEKMNEFFHKFKDEWNTEEPMLGHQERFLKRLEKPKKKVSYRSVLAIAATIVVLLGVFIGYNSTSERQMVQMSPENKEAQQYFSSIIKKELAELKKETDPESKKIIEDAIKQLDKLDKDYQKLITELSEKGENKQIIHAMVTNLQTRISFLQDVETQIENIKKLKAKYHEKNTL